MINISNESDLDSTPLLIDNTCTLEKYSDNKNKKNHSEISNLKKGNHSLPKRYIFSVLAFIGMVNIYSMRSNLSVAILAMSDNSMGESKNAFQQRIECPELLNNVTTNQLKVDQADRYNWTEETVNRILGSFFYGYVITQIPGGYFAEQMSGKWLFGGGVFITALLTIATPLAVKGGVDALITIRILEGLAGGVTHSSMNSMISRWSPKCERSRVSSFIFSGSLLGFVFTLPVSGWLSSSRIIGGWPSAFYTFGVLSMIWFVFWSVFVYDSPAEHPNISKNELLYFEENQEIIHKNPEVPWKDIFTSIPVWAVTVCHFGSALGFLTLFTALPSYFETVLHFDIETDGNLSALPFLCEAFGAWIAACVADRIREANKLTITSIRKIFNTIGLVGPAVVLFFVTLSGCRPQLIVALVCLAMALHGFSFSGFQVTHIDMSPDFAGVLFGITSTIADLNGIIGPALVTYFTYNEPRSGNWNNVFYVMCLGYSLAAIVYLIFASAELQPWGLDKKAISIKTSVSKEIDVSTGEQKKKPSSSVNGF